MYSNRILRRVLYVRRLLTSYSWPLPRCLMYFEISRMANCLRLMLFSTHWCFTKFFTMTRKLYGSCDFFFKADSNIVFSLSFKNQV